MDALLRWLALLLAGLLLPVTPPGPPPECLPGSSREHAWNVRDLAPVATVVVDERRRIAGVERLSDVLVAGDRNSMRLSVEQAVQPAQCGQPAKVVRWVQFTALDEGEVTLTVRSTGATYRILIIPVE